MLGLKSHDCHVLLQRVLPVGIRKYLKKRVCTPLMELSHFFQQICAKTLSVAELDKLEVDIVLILCKLEKIFPPAFFDVMVHLVIHLPREAKLAGPVGYRWMYPIERYCPINYFVSPCSLFIFQLITNLFEYLLGCWELTRNMYVTELDQKAPLLRRISHMKH